VERCSILAAERDESMLGSAFTQAGLLLVEQPGAWGRQGLAESDFDADIATRLQARADEADLRLLAIRRVERSAPARRSWAVRPSGSATTWWGTYADDAELLDLPLDTAVARHGEPAAKPAYLVCTHSKRDLCCAVYARPIAAELDALRPGQAWGCSHTGGHRFAPVVVSVPTSGDVAVYGRVAASDVPDLVAATEGGSVVPGLLRGLAGRPAYLQAALAHALAIAPVPGEWSVVDARADGSDRWRVELAGPRALTLEVSATTSAEPMVSCGKPAPSEQTHYRVLST